MLSKPVIAAISGPAVAGGMELALWCDMRVMERSAYMGVYCRRWGVPLIDGGTMRLPRIVGHGRAMDLILTGRKVEAEECLQIGLASRLCEDGTSLDVALGLAEELARFPQGCMRADRMSAMAQWSLDPAAALVNEWRSVDTFRAEGAAGAARFAFLARADPAISGDMMGRLTTIGFDADDTLWQNEQFFRITQERFQALLADHADPDHISERLFEAEKRNLGRYGFGIKGFTLSMIETAIEITEDRVPASVIRQILEAGREMLEHPVETLPHVRETLERLTGRYRILLVTKGDLFDQERKLAAIRPRRVLRRGRDRQRQDASDLRARLRAPRRRCGARHDGRQFAQIRCRAGDRGRRLGRLRAARTDLGAGACRAAARRSPLPRDPHLGELEKVIVATEEA
jgi:hypothetical protein